MPHVDAGLCLRTHPRVSRGTGPPSHSRVSRGTGAQLHSPDASHRPNSHPSRCRAADGATPATTGGVSRETARRHGRERGTAHTVTPSSSAPACLWMPHPRWVADPPCPPPIGAHRCATRTSPPARGHARARPVPAAYRSRRRSDDPHHSGTTLVDIDLEPAPGCHALRTEQLCLDSARPRVPRPDRCPVSPSTRHPAPTDARSSASVSIGVRRHPSVPAWCHFAPHEARPCRRASRDTVGCCGPRQLSGPRGVVPPVSCARGPSRLQREDPSRTRPGSNGQPPSPTAGWARPYRVDAPWAGSG